jgi:hypothetical protein
MSILSDWRVWIGAVLFVAAMVLMIYFSERD